MKSLKLKVKIDAPVSKIFEFTTNPKNTPIWIDSIVHEEVNEFSPKLGSIYRNKDKNGVWGEYKVTEFEKDKMFIFSSTNSSYHVKYTFTPIDENSCELEYYEWVDEGELNNPFTMEPLQKLKELMEND